jgi:hypothetical protein
MYRQYAETDVDAFLHYPLGNPGIDELSPDALATGDLVSNQRVGIFEGSYQIFTTDEFRRQLPGSMR